MTRNRIIGIALVGILILIAVSLGGQWFYNNFMAGPTDGSRDSQILANLDSLKASVNAIPDSSEVDAGFAGITAVVLAHDSTMQVQHTELAVNLDTVKTDVRYVKANTDTIKADVRQIADCLECKLTGRSKVRLDVARSPAPPVNPPAPPTAAPVPASVPVTPAPSTSCPAMQVHMVSSSSGGLRPTEEVDFDGCSMTVRKDFFQAEVAGLRICWGGGTNQCDEFQLVGGTFVLNLCELQNRSGWTHFQVLSSTSVLVAGRRIESGVSWRDAGEMQNTSSFFLRMAPSLHRFVGVTPGYFMPVTEMRTFSLFAGRGYDCATDVNLAGTSLHFVVRDGRVSVDPDAEGFRVVEINPGFAYAAIPLNSMR